MITLEAFFGAFAGPLFQPAQFLAVLAMALLMSLWEPERVDQGLKWVAGGSALGISVAMFATSAHTDVPMLVCTIVVAAAVADHSNLPRGMSVALAACVGLGIGLGSLPSTADTASSMAACVGVSIGTCTWVFHASTIARRLRLRWGEQHLRMIGSWAIAGAVMLIVMPWAAPR